MWAVGCVTVVLLTGGLAFCDPVSNVYSEKLARECNLEFLRRSREWKIVRQRPTEFVEKLLVLDENARLSAEEALQHSWFYNEVHKDDFEELYQRTIKHWRQRTPKSNLVEFQDGGRIRSLECSQDFLSPPRRSMANAQSPVEPPYKPFPRRMQQTFWPPRSPTKGLSEEVLSAMERSSPSSAAILRIRADLMSPRDRSATPLPRESAVTLRPRNARASSEPPPTLRRRSSALFAENFPKPALPLMQKAPQHTNHGAGQTVPVVRPPTPKPRRQLSVERLEAQSPSALSFTDPTSGVSSAVEQASQSSLGAAGGDTPVRPPSPLHDGSEANAEDFRTPRSNSKLKRRSSTSLTTPPFKKRRSSSVFDLVEDSNTKVQARNDKPHRRSIFELSDGNGKNIPRLPRLPLTHRPKDAPTAARLESPLASLYLPR